MLIYFVELNLMRPALRRAENHQRKREVRWEALRRQDPRRSANWREPAKLVRSPKIHGKYFKFKAKAIGSYQIEFFPLHRKIWICFHKSTLQGYPGIVFLSKKGEGGKKRESKGRGGG